MHLHRIQITNYRAIRKATLTFDRSTILIGENDSGKSSLLEALALVLCGEDPAGRLAPHHVHSPNGGRRADEIRIRLTFSEREPREWDGTAYEPLLAMLPDHGSEQTRRRKVHLELRATVPSNGPARVRWRISWRGADGWDGTDDHELVSLLRRSHPPVWVGAGLPAFEPALRSTCVPGGAEPSPEAVSGSRSTAEDLVLELMERGRRMLAAPTVEMKAEMDSAFQTAQKLLEQVPRSTAGAAAGGSLTAVISEAIDGGRAWAREPSPQTLVEASASGTAAQKLAVLLLAATLLRAEPEGLPKDAEPMLIIEDPEAHLHPLTLAAFWKVIERIDRQRLVTTQSAALIQRTPLTGLRRLTRYNGYVRAWRVSEGTLDDDELRRFTYHVLARRGEATFARCWLLVEGETEFWMLPELARIAGHDLGLEGVACIEFAQAGVTPIIKAAQALGIEWHVLADGDEAGRIYASTALEFRGSSRPEDRVTLLPHRDIEHCFFAGGYDAVYRTQAGGSDGDAPPHVIIRRAIQNRSKPALGLHVLDAVAARGRSGIPAALAQAIETCVDLARRAPAKKRTPTKGEGDAVIRRGEQSRHAGDG
jgi:putative ATP-dependent endonuclease of OLD family